MNMRIFFILFSITCYSTMLHTSTKQPMTATTLNDHDPIHIFAALKFPVTKATDTFTVNLLKEIDNTYGATGMNLDALQIAHIKNSYLYLIFLAKLHKVQHQAQYKKYKTDFAPFLTDNGQASPHLPTTKLITSPGWNNVTITTQDLINSPMWQLFCQSMICDAYAYFAIGLGIIHNIEKQEFNYIPHFETSYYNQDYTNLRTINSIVRTKILLEHNVKNHYVAQTNTWKNLPTTNSKQKTQGTTIEQAVVAFRQSPFYQSTHDLHTLMGTRATVNAGQPITGQQLLQAPQLKSPLKEYVFCYFMLYEMYGQITTAITQQNLASTLGILSRSQLTPNIVPYSNKDFVPLNALLAVKSKAEGTHVLSIHPSPKTFKPEDFRKKKDMLNPSRESNQAYMKRKFKPQPAVQAQFWGIGHFFSHVGSDIAHDATSAFNDVKSGVEAAGDAIADGAEAVGYGIAGMACKAIFFVPSIAAEGEDLSNESQQKFIDSANELQDSINDFSASIKDGIIAPLGEVTGDLVGFILQDQKIGADISSVIDSTAGAIVQAAAQAGSYFAVATGEAIQGAMDAVEAANDITTLIAAGAMAIFSAQGRDDFLQSWHDTLHDCVTAMTAAYTEGMVIVKANVAAVMQAMGAVINSITTLFIDLSREVTFLFMTVADATIGGIVDAVTGQKYNPIAYGQAAEDHVTNKLEAHRQVINQVMGVVACIAADAVVDVATAGAGTAADAEMDVMIMGAAEGAAEAGTEAATEAASEVAQQAVSDAADSVDSATENLANAIKQGTKSAIKAAKQALEDAKGQLAKAITKESSIAGRIAERQAQDEAQAAVSDAADEVDTATSDLADAEAEGDEEAINSAKQALNQAKEKLAQATEKETKIAADVVKKQALKDTADALKDEAKTWTAKALKAAKNKVNNAIDSLKSLPKDIAKSVTNILKSNSDLAEEAAGDASTKADALSEAQRSFDAAKTTFTDSLDDGSTDEEIAAAKQKFMQEAKNLQTAQQESKEAEEFAKASEKIAKEGKAGKALRYLKNGFKVFKPLGFIMNVAFNFTMMISGYNQDEQNLLQQSQQAQSLRDLWQANTQMKLSTAQTSLANLEETSLKQQAAVGNGTLGLALYQNYTYSFINQYQQSILNALAPTYIMQLLPDTTTNLIPGNIGTQWGINSNYLDLYPSQGFYSTTTGRADFPFAQEIAQAPRVATQQGATTVTDKQWFNQRCIAIDATSPTNRPKKPTDPLTVKIDLQFLYVLASEFHVGIYMGGHYHDYFSPQYLAQLLNTTPANIQSAFQNLQNALEKQTSTTAYLNPSVIDLNETMLAKMVVIYRDSATDTIKLGVYEHLGSPDWLLQIDIPSAAQLDQQHTYSLQATLNQDSLTVSLFVDNNPAPIIDQTVTVTPIANQRMYGVISSGAAIQWNQLSPQSKKTINSTARPTQNTTPEIQREKQAKVELADALQPTFGAIPLTPISKQAVLFGQYVYASTKTDLQKIDPKNPADFLLFGTNNKGTITNIGKIPNSIADASTNVLISLISGHVFDLQGNVIKILPNVWTNYKTSTHGPFSPSLDAYITKEQTNMYKLLSKVKFGDFILNIMSPTTLQAGTYIYSCVQTLQANGAPTIDYLVCTTLPSATTSPQLGLPPTATNAQALLSLISGNLYTKTTVIKPNVIPTPQKTYDVFSEFTKYLAAGNVTQADYTVIKAAQIAYVASSAANAAGTPTPAAPLPLRIGSIGSIQSINKEQIATKQLALSATTQKSVPFSFHPKTDIAQGQRQAAGSVKFQFHAPVRKK